ncbi:MAG: RDD family protein [Bryobacteraceae bacterium]
MPETASSGHGTLWTTATRAREHRAPGRRMEGRWVKPNTVHLTRGADGHCRRPTDIEKRIRVNGGQVSGKPFVQNRRMLHSTVMAETVGALAVPQMDEYPGFWRRLGAWSVDAPLRFAIGLGLVYLPMRLLVLGQGERYGSTDPNYLWSVMSFRNKTVVFALWLSAAVIIPWLYTAIQESSTSRATFGKGMMRIQVSDLEGHRVSFKRHPGDSSEDSFPRWALVT